MFSNAERSKSCKNWDWRENPIRMRKGQYWKKNDTGNIGQIVAVSSDHVVVVQPRKSRAHHVTKKDLLMFWRKL